MKSLPLLEDMDLCVIAGPPNHWTSSRNSPPSSSQSSCSKAPEEQGRAPLGKSRGEGEGNTLQPQLRQPINPLLRVPAGAASPPAAPHTNLEQRGACSQPSPLQGCGGPRPHSGAARAEAAAQLPTAGKGE